MPTTQPFPSMASSLYCAEDADDVASWGAADAWAAFPSPPGVLVFPSSLHDPDRPISDLVATELEHMPTTDYASRLHEGSLDGAARLAAIDWILKVNTFYGFQPVTASLSITHLDRFLSSQTLPRGAGWPWQLLSVACLSVAAKMEETHVPLLVDLQILEPRFVFEPRTVRRMELLLMAALRWRMRSATPFDFVDHFAGCLHVDCPGGQDYAPLFRRASDLILGTHRVVHFLGYRPSEIAAAAVLCASGDSFEAFSRFYDVVSKETVEGCRRLMEAYVMGPCPKGVPAGMETPAPQSPAGVLDAAACGSCDTQKSLSQAADPDPDPEPSGGEPPPKRRRLGAIIACTEGSKCTCPEGGEDL
uniref:Cyclin-D4-1 n=1 Tax=Anthurium amnicola TaxID=1678845 RepID=A0A1D1XP81_9ARAE